MLLARLVDFVVPGSTRSARPVGSAALHGEGGTGLSSRDEVARLPPAGQGVAGGDDRQLWPRCHRAPCDGFPVPRDDHHGRRAAPRIRSPGGTPGSSTTATPSVRGVDRRGAAGPSGGRNQGEYMRFSFRPPQGTSLSARYVRGRHLHHGGQQRVQLARSFHGQKIALSPVGRVDRAWLTFQHRCDTGRSLIGEIRYRMPADGGDLLVGPRLVRGRSRSGTRPTPWRPCALSTRPSRP